MNKKSFYGKYDLLFKTRKYNLTEKKTCRLLSKSVKFQRTTVSRENFTHLQFFPKDLWEWSDPTLITHNFIQIRAITLAYSRRERLIPARQKRRISSLRRWQTLIKTRDLSSPVDAWTRVVIPARKDARCNLYLVVVVLFISQGPTPWLNCQEHVQQAILFSLGEHRFRVCTAAAAARRKCRIKI